MLSLTEHSPLRLLLTLNDNDCKELDTIKAALQKHALMYSYAIKTNYSTPIKAAWVCSKRGNYDNYCGGVRCVTVTCYCRGLRMQWGERPPLVGT
jgi:hypothetical protein